MSETLTTLTPSKARRVFSAGLMVVLGAGLLALLVTQPPSGIIRQVALLVIGITFLALARRGWRTTAGGLILRRDGIFDLNGDLICAIDNIAKVDRSLFAFKPANGFIVHLHTPMSRGWTPGLWWRFGRHIGIGGSTPAAQGKQMADILAVLLLDQPPKT